MLAIRTPVDYSPSQTMEELSYTELQPVTIDMSCLITSSSDPRLPEFVEELSYVECIVHTDETFSDQQDCVYSLPDSPESISEAECLVAEDDLLQTRLYEDSRVYDDEDDDESVMLDLMDLSFLDQLCTAKEEEEEEEEEEMGGYGPSFTDSLDTCPTIIVPASSGWASEFHPATPFPSPPTPTPSPSPTSTPTRSAPPSPPSPATTPIASPSSSPSASPITYTFHYCDLPAATVFTITDSLNGSQPPSPPPDSKPVLAEMVSSRRGLKRKAEDAIDFDRFDDSDDENDDEADYKPYCDSRRGAKKNLLWKFLLWTLDHHSDVVCWTDIQKGVFKFVDTARVSTLWGQRKKKRDMTFEKLSRGIRHYYKRGLMERLSHTRLMYKFNWDMVPKRYRKA